jgi:thymidylate kinase
MPGDGIKIVFEGLPGGGKTQIIERLSELGSFTTIPEWILPENQLRKNKTEKPFFLINDLIKDHAINMLSSTTVLLDRYVFGTLAFLECVPSSSREHLCLYREWLQAKPFCNPNILIIIDIPPQTSIARQPRASAAESAFGDPHILSKMREFYLRLPNAQIVDGTLPFPDVFAQIKRTLTRLGVQIDN